MNGPDVIQSFIFGCTLSLANGAEELFGARILFDKFQDFVIGQIVETQST